MPRNIYGNSVSQSGMVDDLRNEINVELANQLVFITNETEARVNLENALSASIIQERNDRESAVDTLTTSINTETVNRSTDTNLLTGAIGQERDNRVTAVGALTTIIEDSNIGNYIEVSRTGTTTTDSGSYGDVNGMNITHPAGAYQVNFSCWIEDDEKKNDDGIEVGISIGNSIVDHSKRRQWTGKAGKYETNSHTQDGCDRYNVPEATKYETKYETHTKWQ